MITPPPKAQISKFKKKVRNFKYFLQRRFGRWELIHDDETHWHYEQRYKWKKNQ